MLLLFLPLLALLLLLIVNFTDAEITTFRLQPGLLFKKNSPKFVHGADPNALTVNGTLYVFCSRDPNYGSIKTGFKLMRDYVLYTHSFSTGWVNHGILRDPAAQFPEAAQQLKGNLMFAPGAIHVDGIFYLFFPYLNVGHVAAWIGVAKSRTPHVKESWTLADLLPQDTRLFDPALLLDPKTNKIHLFGNTRDLPSTYVNQVVRGTLNADMISIQTPGGLVKQFSRGNYVTEGVFAFERKGRYYVMARVQNRCKPVSNRFRYWILNSPEEWVGTVVGRGKQQELTFSPNQYDAPPHESITEYQGRWYLFYHVGRENGGNQWRRSTCVDEAFFNEEDGTILPVKFTCQYRAKK